MGSVDMDALLCSETAHPAARSSRRLAPHLCWRPQAARGATLRTAMLEAGVTPHNGRAALINCRGLGTCGTCAVEVGRPTAAGSLPVTSWGSPALLAAPRGQPLPQGCLLAHAPCLSVHGLLWRAARPELAGSRQPWSPCSCRRLAPPAPPALPLHRLLPGRCGAP